jgi:chorismate dehydratase
MLANAQHKSQAKTKTLRIGSVSYLNAKPLIYGLEHDDQIELGLEVPSKLLDGLREGRFDVALLPVIDYQRMKGLRILPSGGIGCDGETLTVRIFSKVPVQQIRELACDTDSHTSVALARIILAERYQLEPEFVDLSRDTASSCEARLLIGDKVVCDMPRDFAHELDLGAEWKALTGLPFLFAVWMARTDVELGNLPQRLEDAKHAGMEHIDEIVQRHGLSRGWPAAVARRYLSHHMKYDVGPKQLQATRLFYELASKHGVINSPLNDFRF